MANRIALMSMRRKPRKVTPMEFSDKSGIRKVFDLSSPRQLLEKLRWENDQIKNMAAEEDPRVIFAAFNAAAGSSSSSCPRCLCEDEGRPAGSGRPISLF
jgi:hypothetical protein